MKKQKFGQEVLEKLEHDCAELENEYGHVAHIDLAVSIINGMYIRILEYQEAFNNARSERDFEALSDLCAGLLIDYIWEEDLHRIEIMESIRKNAKDP